MGSSKGGNQHTPVIQNDNLRSIANLYVLNGLCEGPIEGFTYECHGHPNGKECDCFKKCIKFNGTPVMNEDGTENYKVECDWRAGLPEQSHISGYFVASGDISNKVSLPVEVMQKHPVSRELTPVIVRVDDVDAEEVSLRFSVDSLYEAHDNGDVNGTFVELNVDLKSQSSDWVRVRPFNWASPNEATIYKKGKASSKAHSTLTTQTAGTGNISHTFSTLIKRTA
jgi:predicted phage tail protein